MRNYSKFDTLSKNITNSKSSLNLANSNNSSHILTANHFFKLKDIKLPNYLSGKNKEITELNNKIIFKINNRNKFIVHNKIINKDDIQPKKKKVNSELELFQDYVLEDYKNQKINDQRNIIEKLGACVEKKYNSRKFFKNIIERNSKLQESSSLLINGKNPLNVKYVEKVSVINQIINITLVHNIQILI